MSAAVRSVYIEEQFVKGNLCKVLNKVVKWQSGKVVKAHIIFLNVKHKLKK